MVKNRVNVFLIFIIFVIIIQKKRHKENMQNNAFFPQKTLPAHQPNNAAKIANTKTTVKDELSTTATILSTKTRHVIKKNPRRHKGNGDNLG
ncbi:MAG: hypothetical protein J6T13_03760 [Bacteroidales bacterium]|nr:hypothetical protein [Bacteroidales bacterium]